MVESHHRPHRYLNLSGFKLSLTCPGKEKKQAEQTKTDDMF